MVSLVTHTGDSWRVSLTASICRINGVFENVNGTVDYEITHFSKGLFIYVPNGRHGLSVTIQRLWRLAFDLDSLPQRYTLKHTFK